MRCESKLREIYSDTIQNSEISKVISQSRLLFNHEVDILKIAKDSIKNCKFISNEVKVEIMHIAGYDSDFAKVEFDSLIQIAAKKGFRFLVSKMRFDPIVLSKPINRTLTEALISTVSRNNFRQFQNIVQSLPREFHMMVGRNLGLQREENPNAMFSFLRRKYFLPKLRSRFDTISKHDFLNTSNLSPDESCTICLETFTHGEISPEVPKCLRDEGNKGIQTPCGHWFHVDCLIEKIGQYDGDDEMVLCPNCRSSLK
jgi:hypothetical protein